MSTDQPADPGNTEFVLPIICPNCSHEINLAMIFALMAPEEKPAETKQNDITEIPEA